MVARYGEYMTQISKSDFKWSFNWDILKKQDVSMKPETDLAK